MTIFTYTESFKSIAPILLDYRAKTNIARWQQPPLPLTLTAYPTPNPGSGGKRKKIAK